MKPAEAPERAGYKRIILCVDGTWPSSDQGDASSPSNVAVMARSIATFGTDAEGCTVSQVVSYHSGLGSGDLPFQKAIYGGVGWGLDHDVCEVYEFISDNYSPGDELFFFGFSRGAFTVRAAAGLVGDIGILSSVNMTRFPEMYEAYRSNTGGKPFAESAWYQNHAQSLGLSSDVRIKVIGVWDTVGALGIPEWPLTVNLEKMGIAVNGKYAFHNTNLSSNVDYAFQALALNEQRLTFPPAVWHETPGSPAVELLQCWFPGVHSNIGGQAEQDIKTGDHGEIGNITFAWMVDNLSGLLTFEEGAIAAVVDSHKKALEENSIANGWGCGPIVSNFTGLLGAFFRVLGKRDRTPGQYQLDPGNGISGPTNEYFHPTVRLRKTQVQSWAPASLNGWSPKEPTGNKGWSWVKQGTHAIPEYQLPNSGMSIAYENPEGGTEFKLAGSLSRLICPREVLLELDRDSGTVNP